MARRSSSAFLVAACCLSLQPAALAADPRNQGRLRYGRTAEAVAHPRPLATLNRHGQNSTFDQQQLLPLVGLILGANAILVTWACSRVWGKREDSAQQELEEVIEQKFPVVKSRSLPSEDKPSCAICLCEIKDGEGSRELQCKHSFHADCVKKWWTQDPQHPRVNCPLCRRKQRGLTVCLAKIDGSYVMTRTETLSTVASSSDGSSDGDNVGDLEPVVVPDPPAASPRRWRLCCRRQATSSVS